jgi:heat-inducible transcriptional repressor
MAEPAADPDTSARGALHPSPSAATASPTGLVLSDRQEQILRAVCRDFIVTGVDVASAALVRRHGFRWSSATLRQELAALERMGLLRRAHRSAGCSPTEAGLRCYVASLPSGRTAQPELITAVDRSLQRLREDPSRGMRAAVCVLSEASGCLAVSFLGTARDRRIAQVDVVPLVGPRALVVLALEGGATHVQPVELDELRATDPGAAQRALQERLRWLCVGRTLPEARETLLRRLHEHEAQVDRLLAHALRVALSLCAVSPLDPLWLSVAGQPTLARTVADAHHLGDVLTLLEDDQRLAELLEQLLPASCGDDVPRARVHVGVRALLDGLYRAARPSEAAGLVDGGVPPGAAGDGPRRGDDAGPGLSLVGCRVPVAGVGPEPGDGGGPNRGIVAILGPARMDYAAMIPLVEYAARALAARMCA